MSTTLLLPHPWTEKDVDRLSSCCSFAAVGKVIHGVVSRLARNAFMVSGPITTGGGSIEENIASYRRAIEYVRRGYPVFDQLPAQGVLDRLWRAWRESNPEGEYCYELLEGVYRPIFEDRLVTGLFFMPNWRSSRGSCWEREHAERLRLVIYHIEPDWHLLQRAS